MRGSFTTTIRLGDLCAVANLKSQVTARRVAIVSFDQRCRTSLMTASKKGCESDRTHIHKNSVLVCSGHVTAKYEQQNVNNGYFLKTKYTKESERERDRRRDRAI